MNRLHTLPNDIIFSPRFNLKNLMKTKLLSKKHKKEIEELLKRMGNKQQFVKLINNHIKKDSNQKKIPPKNTLLRMKLALRRTYYPKFRQKELKKSLNRIEKGASVKSEYSRFRRTLKTVEKRAESMKRVKKLNKTGIKK